ncbi:MAG TPA: zinc-binding dehydrogenase [Micromonosporaceae bacterium]|nr:zinc-binding dehydrogenase [Micromonosporaceae bacterium]
MRAIRQHEFGGPDVLRLEEVPDPEPGPGQVRIAVEAIGVHLLDTSIRAGTSFGATQAPELPMTPGREVAGTVDRVGSGVDAGWLGRRVVAHLGQASGGYAELAVVAAARAYEIPPTLDAPTAVAAIGTGRTAMGILDLAAIKSSDVVAVTSAAGGLGVLLLQGARSAGARAIALAGGAAKLEVAARFGATSTIDYRATGWHERLADEPPLTVVLDGVGGEVGRLLYQRLAPGGRLVRYGWSSGEENTYDDPDRPVVEVLGPPILDRLAELEQRALTAAAEGRIVPYVGSVFPLADAAAAHRALEDRETIGKVVLVTGAARGW